MEIDLIITLFKYRMLLLKSLKKINPLDRASIIRSLEFNDNKLEKILSENNYSIDWNYEMKPYDKGIPCDPINIDEFDSLDNLFIQSIMEPVILKDGTVVHRGKILLQSIDLN